MATLDEAELARVKHAERLRKLGAHGIEVRKRKGGDWAVVALFKKPPRKLPEQLEITHQGVAKTVPLQADIKEEFQPE